MGHFHINHSTKLIFQANKVLSNLRKEASKCANFFDVISAAFLLTTNFIWHFSSRFFQCRML